MDCQAIIDAARTSLDSDTDETPDDVMLVWIQQGFNRIVHELSAAGYFRAYQTKTATAGLSTLTLTTKAADVQQVIGPTFVLEPIPFERGQELFPLNKTEASPSTTGLPIYWSIMPSHSPDESTTKIWLWPAPSVADSYGIWYVAQQADPSTYTVTSVPAIPTEFHPLLVEYLCARGYELQQNAQMATVKFNRFEAELDMQMKDFTRSTKAQALTIGGPRSRHLEVPNRLRFTWE